MADDPTVSESTYTLNQAGRLVGVLERCMEDRIRPDRSGWSAAMHLGWDLERHFGVKAPLPAIERALRILGRRKRVQLKVDEENTLWYRLLEG